MFGLCVATIYIPLNSCCGFGLQGAAAQPARCSRGAQNCKDNFLFYMKAELVGNLPEITVCEFAWQWKNN